MNIIDCIDLNIYAAQNPNSTRLHEINKGLMTMALQCEVLGKWFKFQHESWIKECGNEYEEWKDGKS